MRFNHLINSNQIKTSLLSNWKYVIIIILLISMFLPLIENINYPFLTSYDTWHFLSFGKQVLENNGIPIWENLDHFPTGRPFLYPPTIPFLLAITSFLININLYLLIKFSTIFIYPLYIFGAIFLATKISDKKELPKVTILSGVILLSFVQAYINSINSLSQFAEIFLVYLLVYFLLTKKYYTIPFVIGTLFFTHFFTPFLSLLGTILTGIFSENKSTRNKIVLFAIGGLLIGSIWLVRYLLFFDFVHLNSFMPEHFILNSHFIWRVFVEGPAFALVLILIIVIYFTSSKKTKKSILDDKLNQLLIIFSISFIPAFIYPERAVTYIAPFISIICAQLIVKAKIEQLKIASLFLTIPLFIIILFYLMGPRIFITYYSMFCYLTFLSFIFILIVFFLKRFKLRKSFFIIVFILLIFTYADSEVVFPFFSWYTPGVNTQKANSYGVDAVEWIAQNAPNAIVATNSYKIDGYLVYKNIKTSGYVVIEFSKRGAVTETAGATHFIEIAPFDPNNPIYKDFFGSKNYEVVWRKGNTTIFEKKDFETKLE